MTKTKIFVAYRSNGLFEQYVPDLVEGMDIVDVFVVPQGVTLDAVREAAIESVERAKANGAEMIVADSTCSDLGFVKGPEDRWGKPRFPKSASLDRLFQKQISAHNPQSTVADNFAWFASSLTEGRTVKSVVVVKSEIADHDFAGIDPGQTGRLDEEKRAKWIVAQLGAIFPDATSQIVWTLQEALMYADDPDTLIVLDRHCGIKAMMAQEGGWYNSLDNWPYPSMLYILPFETSAANLVGRGGFDFAFDLAAMRQDLLKNA